MASASNSKSGRKRGQGMCECGKGYMNRYKTESCEDCGKFLGGKRVKEEKIHKQMIPDSVTIMKKDSLEIYSCEIRSSGKRGDRCLVMLQSKNPVCLKENCQSLRAVATRENSLTQFNCVHIDSMKFATEPLYCWSPSEEILQTFPETGEDKRELIALASTARTHGYHVVVKLYDKCFAVLGPSDTTNTTGYCHVQQVYHSNESSHFICSGKSTGTTKTQKSRPICIHVWFAIMADKETLHEERSLTNLNDISNKNKSYTPSLQIRNSAELKLMREKIPYIVPHEIIKEHLKLDRNTAVNGNPSLPEKFIPNETVCAPCRSQLGDPKWHPGSDKTSYLFTTNNPFKNVEVYVKSCQNKQCQALTQASSLQYGKFS